MVKTFKNLLLQSQKSNDLEIGMQHQGLKLYKIYINDPGLTLTHFTASQIGLPMRSNGKTVTKSFNGENLQQKTKLTE